MKGKRSTKIDKNYFRASAILSFFASYHFFCPHLLQSIGRLYDKNPTKIIMFITRLEVEVVMFIADDIHFDQNDNRGGSNNDNSSNNNLLS